MLIPKNANKEELLKRALTLVSPSAFKLYYYFLSQPPGATLIISLKELEATCGLKKKAYGNAWRDLCDQRFILPLSKNTNTDFFISNLPSQEVVENENNNITYDNIGSFGEQKIAMILDENKIPYQAEAVFEGCLFPDTCGIARFDFFVDEKYLIEFDGEQHYKAVEPWGGKNGLKKRIEHDKFKNQWCKENNIPLIRIPYTQFNTLTIEDLLLEATQFRVV